MELDSIVILMSACFVATIYGSTPAIVTLSHGGQLEGKTYTLYNNTEVTVFLGVPYAKPPLNSKRFKKPENLEPWTGVKNATKKAEVCVQLSFEERVYVGSEDCLYLDITIPGRIDNTANKTVMVWIHGGGYAMGSASDYTTTALSVKGDVIGVGISYRLGALGFLNEGPGTGNYGLWDQHYGLKWVKNNIAMFGGDPNKITIFGESAGAGSVSAQAVSSQNDITMFQRVIQQSGSIFTPWSWVGDTKHNLDIVCKIRNDMKCSTSDAQFIGDCLSSKSAVEIEAMFAINQYYNSPVMDGDFFTASDGDRSYDNAKRFDLLIGHNSREGRFVMQQGGNYSNGFTVDEMKESILLNCAYLSSTLDPSACMERMSNIYGLTNSSYTDKQRVLELITTYGDALFVAETERQADLMAGANRKVYAYRLDKGTPAQYEPTYVVEGATHADDLYYIFDSPFLRMYQDVIIAEEFNGKDISDFWMRLNDTYAPLSDLMVKMWTNFAKTGNPNTPESSGLMDWPQYQTTDRQFFKFDDKSEVITKTQTERNHTESLIVLFDEAANTVIPKEKCAVVSSAAVRINGHTTGFVVFILLVLYAGL